MAAAEHLISAARSGDTKPLGSMRDADLLKRLAGENTGAHLAAKFGKEPCLRVMVERQPDLLLAANSNGDTPLHLAARLGQTPCVISLLQAWKSNSSNGSSVRSRSSSFRCVIEPTIPEEEADQSIEAVATGLRTDIVVVSAAAGKMPKMKNKHGNTALHEAIRGRHSVIVTDLLGADPMLVSITNNFGESPIYLASDMALVDILRDLLGHSNIASYDGPGGKNALHAAASRGHIGLEVADMLLKANEYLNRRGDENGNTALHYASSIGDKRMVKLLLDADASVAALCNADGRSPVHVAATVGHVHIVNEILQRRPDVADLRDNNGRTFLHLAVEHEMRLVISHVLGTEWLRELLNVQDNDGNTPIHMAVVTGSRQILRMFLVDRRVDKNITNFKGKNPLDRASTIAQTSMELRKYKIMKDLQLAGSMCSPRVFDVATVSQRRRPEEEEIRRSRDIVQNLTVTSVLIATVTFAAAFTLPGGYLQDDKPDHLPLGTAALVRRAAFKVFVISDAVAMASSVIITFLLIQTGSWDHDIRSYSIRLSMKLAWLAIMGLVVAFATGLYVAIAPNCMWLALVVISISCCVPAAIFVLNWYPSGYFESRTRMIEWMMNASFSRWGACDVDTAANNGGAAAAPYATPLTNSVPPRSVGLQRPLMTTPARSFLP